MARVKLNYEVHTGNALQIKELAYVMAVLADLSGTPKKKLPKFKLRKFTEIDRNNFNKVMAKINPGIRIKTTNKLTSGSPLELCFSSMDDFNPVKIIQKVAALKKLYETREKLSDLVTKIENNDPLDEVLKRIFMDTKEMEKINLLHSQDRKEEKCQS